MPTNTVYNEDATQNTVWIPAPVKPVKKKEKVEPVNLLSVFQKETQEIVSKAVEAGVDLGGLSFITGLSQGALRDALLRRSILSDENLKKIQALTPVPEKPKKAPRKKKVVSEG